MAGAQRKGARLAPAGHAGVDEPVVAQGAVCRPESEAPADAGPVALDEDVGPFDESQGRGQVARLLQVKVDGPAAAHQLVRNVPAERVRAPRPVHAHDVGAEVSEQHRSMRAGTDAAALQHQ